MSKFGICPICGGRVIIKFDEKQKRNLGECVNNKADHVFTYDHTIDRGYWLKPIIVKSN